MIILVIEPLTDEATTLGLHEALNFQLKTILSQHDLRIKGSVVSDSILNKTSAELMCIHAREILEYR